MNVPSLAVSFEVLCLQLAGEGRGDALFGASSERARTVVRPFMVGKEFPSVYFEMPLVGNPFLDVTVLYGDVEPGTRIESSAAGEHGAMLDWFAEVRAEHEDVSCGFELDTKNVDLTAAAVHFQPRRHKELVEPFCQLVDEPERASLYLDLDRRMPEGWSLSFFGMFRGRPGSPLRVCGYLDRDWIERCADDPCALKVVFDDVGFSAYNQTMIEQVSELMAVVPGSADFQFDVYPDGSLGPTFAVDAQFEIAQPELVHASFAGGPGARLMDVLERWGIADGRWRTAIDATFARGIPVDRGDGTQGTFGFTIMPQWVKVRWTDAVLQPSKLYFLGNAKLVDSD